MADATVTEIRQNVVGNIRMVTGKAVTAASDTTPDINTGLKHVVACTLAGVDTEDRKVGVSRNSKSTTEQDADYPGWIHLVGAPSAGGVTYRFCAIGT